jgi:hypothetical protein
MLKKNDIENNTNQNIYISIDHLKKGNYILNVTLKNKIIKFIKIQKTDISE